MAFTTTPEFIFDITFAAVHLVANVVLFVLIILLRNNKIIKVRSFAMPFGCFAQIIACIGPAVGHINDNAKCFLFFFVSSPFSLGSLAAFTSAYFKNMLLKRLQLLRREYMARKNGTSTDNTASTIDYSSPSEKDEESDDEAELEEKHEEEQQQLDQTDSKTSNQKQNEMAERHEKMKKKLAARNARRSVLAKYMAVVKRLAGDWMLLFQILAVILVLELAHLLVLVINRAGASGPFASRCIANNTANAIVDLIALIIFMLILGAMVAANLILSYKELGQCKLKEVLYDNDPFLFIILSVVLMVFLVLFVVAVIVLGLKLGVQSGWTALAKVVFTSIPITWIEGYVPIVVALYRQIRIIKIARKASPAKQVVQAPSSAAKNVQTDATHGPPSNSGKTTKGEFNDELFKHFNTEPDVIEYLMEHKTLSVMFKSFAEKEYSDENIYFYMAVKKMQAAGKKKKKISRRRVQELQDTFLTSSSPMEVNVPAPVRDACKSVLAASKSKKLETPTALITTCLDASITNLGDIYRRFYASSQFRNFLKQIGSS